MSASAMNAAPGQVRWPGPAISAHTDELQGEVLAMSLAAITKLRKDQVI